MFATVPLCDSPIMRIYILSGMKAVGADEIVEEDESGEFDPQGSDDVNPEEEAEVDVVDEEEETEIQVDHMLNNDIEDDDQPSPIPPSHVYNPPQHMTNMDMHDDETSTSVFYNPYVIECRNILCKFRLAASYKKKKDSWEIASIDPPHSCIATNVEQDHRKLSIALICQDILPLVNKDPSVKVIESLSLFWAFDPCIKGFAFYKPIIQIAGTCLYSKYRGTLLMAVAQDDNNNVFPIAFALVEGETAGGWGFFL
ncbi:hypothetical protein KIW84_060931 [Lathyrus oleraceus]|uniref:MULE transposase domain-containing protein n=1 Tax=Pisum sativum TaxID=3888 RepID=A0A9D5A3M8_PEA|nr:hypothetical protein KIW84_060931 [Pisum sativum]